MSVDQTEGTALADELRASAADAVTEASERLVRLSRDLHARPELAFEEVYAAERVSTELADAGFAVELGAYGVPTAFEAVYGSGDFTAVLCAEYDALPGLGHACGHNMIATITTGAAIALREAADRLGIRIVVLGTPAEEHGGGKCVLLRAGAFEQATVSLMVHGYHGPVDVSAADVTCQAVDRFDITFTGRAAHAAAAPQAAVNAGSAAALATVAIGLARQHFPDGVRVSAVTVDAGEVTNIVPAEAHIKAEVRSTRLDEMLDVKRRVLACFEGAAIATGCGWEQRRSEPRYLDVIPDPGLSAAWDANARRNGRVLQRPPGATGGSTDMGNVSHVVPSIHPMLVLEDAGGPPHTIEFAAASGAPQGDRLGLEGATILAQTVIDVASDAELRADLVRRAAERPAGATMVDQDGD